MENLDLTDLENYRIKKQKATEIQSRNSLYLFLASVFAIILYVLLFYSSLNKHNYLLLLLFFLPNVIYQTLYVKDYQKTYENKFRREVLTHIIHLIDENMHYLPSKKMKKGYFDESNFIVSYDTFKSEDFIEGSIDSKKIISSEVEVCSKSKNSETTLFQGMFCVVEFEFPKNLILDILSDEVSHFGKLGTLFQKMNVCREALIKIENSSFEENFVVYSNAPNLARSILTTDLQEILISFALRSGVPTHISIREGRLFFGINSEEDLFQVKLNESLLNNKTIENQLHQFTFYFDFIKEVSKIVESKTSSIINLSIYELS